MDSFRGVDYLTAYGSEPSAIEQVFAIYANVIELDDDGPVINAKYAEKRATDYLRAYFDPTFVVARDVWSGRRDLNPRPPDPQSGALPSCATPRRSSNRTGGPVGAGGRGFGLQRLDV